MILLLDLGNSRLKWACLEGRELQAQAPVDYRGKDFAPLARSLWAELEAPTRVLAANVGGADIARRLRTWVKRRWKCDVEFIEAVAESHGVRNAYAEPARLGVDRWAAMLAAHAQVRGPVCVVDCGTAITIDVLAADGRHLGGLILPGLRLMRESLIQGTEAINDDASGAEVGLLARGTQEAIIGGSMYAAVAVIDRVRADLAQALGETLTTLITGGDAERILPLLAAGTRHEPALVLQGLAVLVDTP